jgi:hypothetical protein
VKEFDVKTGNKTLIGTLTIKFPQHSDAMLDNTAIAVNQESTTIYGVFNSRNHGFTILFRYNVKENTTQQSSNPYHYNIYHLIYDENNRRLYGLRSVYLDKKEELSAPILVEYNPDTLDEIQTIGNYSKYGSSYPGGFYLPKSNQYLYHSLFKLEPHFVSLNLNKIPEQVKTPNEVNIVDNTISFEYNDSEFVLDPSVTSPDGTPLVFTVDYSSIISPMYLYQFKADTGELVNSMKISPMPFHGTSGFNPIVIDPDTHELIALLFERSTSDNYIVRVDIRSFQILSTVKVMVASSDDPLIFVRF